MSLLFAPRWTYDATKIRKGYYHDFDLYFRDEATQQKVYGRLIGAHGGSEVADTVNATTVRVGNKEFQLMKYWLEDPIDIIVNYDFMNCACALTLHDNKIHVHKECFKWHLKKELEILNPWMIMKLGEDTSDIHNRVITQLLRFKKYCKRWGYTLSKNSLELLIKTYQQFPDLEIKKKQYVPCAEIAESNEENPESFLPQYLDMGSIGDNVWSAMAETFTASPYWSHDMDSHNKIIPTIPPSNTLEDELPF